MNLVLLEPGEAGAGGVVTLQGARGRHLVTVLKVTPGQRIRVGVIDGPRGMADVESVESIGGETVTLRCTFEEAVPPRPRVDLLLALPRPKVMRRLWAQLAAMGVGQIILTNAERVERNYFDTNILSPEVYRPLLVEGLQQARDTRLPRVSIHRQFRKLVEDDLDALVGDGPDGRDSIRLVADPNRSASVSVHGRDRVLLAVGPEGGWNAFEMKLLEAHRFEAVGMGPRTLRTDTACIALLALVHGACDWRP
jgi:RsmE family RNA methyltransferase